MSLCGVFKKSHWQPWYQMCKVSVVAATRLSTARVYLRQLEMVFHKIFTWYTVCGIFCLCGCRSNTRAFILECNFS